MSDRYSDRYDVIILGGGAAGLMCAAVAGQRGRRVLLIEHADKPGKKILISGGGRCNFTNLHTAPDRYISSNPHFVKSALSRYTAADFIALVDRYNIAWHEKTLGQLFCNGSARQIVALLLDQCQHGGVDLSIGHGISGVSHDAGGYLVRYGARKAVAPSLVVATGGPSIPKMGATGFAYDLARQFGLPVVEPRPALVPLTLGGDEILFRSLSGVASDIIAKAGKAEFREAGLFTHRGLSGPAILQISSYWRHGDPLYVDFVPDTSPDWLIDQKRSQPQTNIRKTLSNRLPDRLAATLFAAMEGTDAGMNKELANIADRTLRAAGERLKSWTFHPNGTEGYAKAEVTAGGISTAELSSQTMEARRQSGLFIIGEAVDVTGWLGGYNFQWAWSSGWATGQAV